MSSHCMPYTALADIYDAVATGYDYGRAVDVVCTLYERLTQQPCRNLEILDVGCGTGRAMMEFAARDHSVLGVDSSAEMLTAAAERLSQMQDRSMLVCQDMRQLDLGQRRFDLAVALYGSFNCLSSPAELETSLAMIAASLKPSGVVVFDTVTASKLSSPRGLNACVIEGSDYMLTWEKSWQPRRRLWRFELDWFARRGPGDNALWARHTEIHSQCGFEPGGVAKALKGAGFRETLGPLTAYELLEADSDTERVFYAARLTQGDKRSVMSESGATRKQTPDFP